MTENGFEITSSPCNMMYFNDNIYTGMIYDVKEGWVADLKIDPFI